MNTNTEHEIIEREVFRITATLMQATRQDAHGIYWTTPSANQHATAGESIDLFNGTSGIVLFLLALYRYTHNERYLQTCIRAVDRLLQHPAVQQPVYYTFYGGATGVLFVCMQLYSITSNSKYLSVALQLEQTYRSGFNERVSQHDVLSGQAGILLAISHVYDATREASLLPTITNTLQKIVRGACVATAGLKWDTFKHGYDSLTGFSHGASGIAFTLLQAGRYFNAPGLTYLARQALLYESNYYEKATGNFMDLRVGVERMKTIREQYAGELPDWPLHIFQPTMSQISSWAHGAAGCAVARLYAFEITGNHIYAQEATGALQYSWEYYNQQQKIDYSLCSGYGGIAAIFQLAAHLLQQPVWQTRAKHMACSAIAYYQQQQTYNSKLSPHVHDNGLFSGLAGVGYWLLGCLQPHRPDTILHPALPASQGTVTDDNPIAKQFTRASVKEMLFSRYYPQTLNSLEAIDKQIANELCQKADDLGQFNHLVQTHLLNHAQKPFGLTDIFRQEEEVTKLWSRHKGFLQFRQRRQQQQQSIDHYIQLPDEHLRQLVFEAPNHITVTKGVNNSQQLYYCHEAGISNMSITDLSALLLSTFRQQQLLETVIARVKEQNNWNYKTDLSAVIIQQTRELVRAGFLVEVKKKEAVPLNDTASLPRQK
jgi:class II lanthipeptide synthase